MSRKALISFGFRPSRQVLGADAGKPVSTREVARHLTIEAPPQIVDGRLQKVVVVALPMPTKAPPKPPAKKGIKRLICPIVNLLVQVEETGETLFRFKPALTLIVEFTARDAKAALRDPETGKPRLSIVVCYKARNEWRWKRLHTDVEYNKRTGRGTLKAEIKTLHPIDPCWEGSP